MQKVKGNRIESAAVVVAVVAVVVAETAKAAPTLAGLVVESWIVPLTA